MKVEGEEQCVNCGSPRVTSKMLVDDFAYGVAPYSVMLKAEVEVFECAECHETYTGVQAEAAHARAVNDHLASRMPQMVDALRAQHDAIDTLFAMLIAKTMHAEHPFYPSESGKPWEAMLAGKAAIEAVGVPLHG